MTTTKVLDVDAIEVRLAEAAACKYAPWGSGTSWGLRLMEGQEAVVSASKPAQDFIIHAPADIRALIAAYREQEDTLSRKETACNILAKSVWDLRALIIDKAKEQEADIAKVKLAEAVGKDVIENLTDELSSWRRGANVSCEEIKTLQARVKELEGAVVLYESGEWPEGTKAMRCTKWTCDVPDGGGCRGWMPGNVCEYAAHMKCEYQEPIMAQAERSPEPVDGPVDGQSRELVEEEGREQTLREALIGDIREFLRACRHVHGMVSAEVRKGEEYKTGEFAMARQWWARELLRLQKLERRSEGTGMEENAVAITQTALKRDRIRFGLSEGG